MAQAGIGPVGGGRARTRLAYARFVRGLEGKVAVVAGGAGSIGTASSVRLAEEGVSVVVGDLDGDAATAVAEQITSAGGRAVAVVAVAMAGAVALALLPRL